jgi:hypothetical protein
MLKDVRLQGFVALAAWHRAGRGLESALATGWKQAG